MAFPPFTFAGQSGNVPASELDSNFAACLPLATTQALSLVGNNVNGNGNNINLTAAQSYQILKTAIPWEVVMFMSGVQASASQQLMRYQPSTAVVIVQGSCYASSGVAFTASKTFVIADNGTTIGSIVFSASGTTGTVTITGTPYTLAAGRVLTITGPASADSTGANMNVTLAGNRN